MATKNRVAREIIYWFFVVVLLTMTGLVIYNIVHSMMTDDTETMSISL